MGKLLMCNRIHCCCVMIADSKTILFSLLAINNVPYLFCFELCFF